MNRFWIWGLGALLACSGYAQTAAELNRSQNMRAQDAACVLVLASAMGLKVDYVLHTRSEISYPIFDLAPVYPIARDSGRTPTQIWTRHKARTWPEIAQDLKVLPGEFKRAAAAGVAIGDYIWQDLVRRRYGWSAQEWRGYQGPGWKQEDVVCLAYFSKGDRKTAAALAKEFETSRNWHAIMTRLQPIKKPAAKPDPKKGGKG